MNVFHAKYNYEVHIATYSDFDWVALPKPFFLNQVCKPNPISAIVTAETKHLSRAKELYEEINFWCHSNEILQAEGCRITLEEMVTMKDIDSRQKNHRAIEKSCWHMEENAHTAFSDVHADGKWDEALYQRLVSERDYLPIDYITRRGERLAVLTLHFLEPAMAVAEAHYLDEILSHGGFSGTLSVENSLEVSVIGPPHTRPMVTNGS